MYNVSMGYYDPEDKHLPGASLYHRAESEHDHHFSMKQICLRYGYNKYKEYIPFKDYASLPALYADDIIKYITEGESQRYADDLARAKREKGETDGNEEDFLKAQAEMKKMLDQYPSLKNFG